MEAVEDLVTPCFVVRKEVIERNTSNMIQSASLHRVSLRPHVKTHKTLEGARLQLGGLPKKIVVSTLGEAEFFSKEIDDIIYGVPISLEKLPKIKELASRITIHIFVDNQAVLDGVSKFARQNKTKISVFLSIDTGYGREGVPIDEERGIQMAQQIDSDPFLIFQGIYCHAGHSYDCHGKEEISKMAETERKGAAEFAKKLEKAGVHVKTVSVGSTPTCTHPNNWEGCNEIHPGNYVFYDCQQVANGSATWDDCAGFVLTSVLSRYPERNRVLVDAGALSLSKDTSPFGGFGHILDHPELVLKKISQEVGIIERVDGGPFGENELPIGTKLKIIPNHSCLSAACFERYYVIDHLNKVVEVWPRCR